MSPKIGRPTETDSGIKAVPTSFAIDPTLFRAFGDICWNEHRSKSDVVSEFIRKFVEDHSQGRDSCKIDGWVQDPELIAMPPVMASPERWVQYLRKQQDSQERQRFIKQTQFLLAQASEQWGIETRQNKQQQFFKDLEEMKLIRLKRSERLRQESDLRNMDPAQMNYTQCIRYNQLVDATEKAKQLKEQQQQQDNKPASSIAIGIEGGN